MKYEVVIEKEVAKFLSIHRELREKFSYCVQCIEVDPLSSYCDTKKMKWMHDVYRLRIGKRRFLYRVQEDRLIIYFFDADSRSSIYKK